MRDLPDDKKKEIITKWLTGESRERIATTVGLTASAITGVINEWKRDLGAAIADAYRGADEHVVGHGANPVDIIRAFKLMLMLKNFGVKAESVDDFITRFAKVVLSTGVTPEGLANILKQVMKLADLDGVEIYQIPAQVEALMGQKRQLETEVEKLNEQKASIQREMPESQPRSEKSTTSIQPLPVKADVDPHATEVVDSELLSEISELRNLLSDFGLSLNDTVAFAGMIRNAKKEGYDFATIIQQVSNMKSLEQKKDAINSEIVGLRDSEAILLEKHHSLEEKLSSQQSLIDAVEKLKELGFDLQDFESIYDRIGKLAELEGLDPASAKSKFFSDLKGLYEAGIKQEKDYQLLSAEGKVNETVPERNNKELLELLERLTSKGVTEQTLMKSVIINDLFKQDLDSLADDLKKYKTVKEAARKAIEVRTRLESEELELKHKLIALEDQRQRLMSSMKDLFDKSRIEVRHSGSSGPQIASEGLLHELEPLARKIRGEIVNLDELKVSLNLVIDAISNALDPQSLTRKILDHAKLALEHEHAKPRNNA